MKCLNCGYDSKDKIQWVNQISKTIFIFHDCNDGSSLMINNSSKRFRKFAKVFYQKKHENINLIIDKIIDKIRSRN